MASFYEIPGYISNLHFCTSCNDYSKCKPKEMKEVKLSAVFFRITNWNGCLMMQAIVSIVTRGQPFLMGKGCEDEIRLKLHKTTISIKVWSKD